MKKEKIAPDKDNCCIIWDQESYPKSILGSCQKKVFDQKLYNDTKFGEYDLIYVLAELKWIGYLRTGFHGFQVAKDLRMNKKILCPIVFCSFMPSFDKKQYPETKILDTPGHYLLQLTDKPFPLKDYIGIDEDTLNDINLSLFDPEQELHELMHNTQAALPALLAHATDKSEMKNKAKELIEKHLLVFEEKVESDKINEFKNLSNKLIKEINHTIDQQNFDPNELYGVFEPFKLPFYGLLQTNLHEGLIEKITPKRWQVLFIDDQPETCNSVKKYFFQNGITCHTAQNAQEAFNILYKDEQKSKRISVIITDFRLYENGNTEIGKWQAYQGYRILNEIHLNPEYKSHYVFSILTLRTGTIQKYIRKQSKFSILWFSKSDVLGGKINSFNLFCRDIVKAGSDAFFKKHSIPAYGGWKNAVPGKVDAYYNYSYLYKMHIEDMEYDNSLINIYKLVTDYLKLDKFPVSEVKQPSFNFKKKDPSKLLELFRNTILPYRLVFLYQKFINQKSDKEIYFFFNPNYQDIYEDKLKSSTILVSEAEQDLIESINGLFYINWGFPLDFANLLKVDNNQLNRKEYRLLFEEYNFLKIHGFEIPTKGLNDEPEIEFFLEQMVELSWNDTTKKMINILLDRFDKATYFDIKRLFNQIRNEILKNSELDDALNKSYLIQNYWSRNTAISDDLKELIENLIRDAD